MARLCERPGCSAPASVAYGFEAARTMVWIEPLTPENADSARVGGLCRRHADSLTAPRGWWLDDRRIALPRLFSIPDAEPAAGETVAAAESTEVAPAVAEPAATSTGQLPAARRERRPKRAGGDHTSELPFVEPPGPPDPAPDPDPEVVVTVVPPRPAPSLPAHDHTRPPSAVVFGGGEPDPDETKAMPWVPTFDRADDLGGVLAARSPLLSRAFGMTHRSDGRGD